MLELKSIKENNADFIYTHGFHVIYLNIETLFRILHYNKKSTTNNKIKRRGTYKQAKSTHFIFSFRTH